MLITNHMPDRPPPDHHLVVWWWFVRHQVRDEHRVEEPLNMFLSTFLTGLKDYIMSKLLNLVFL